MKSKKVDENWVAVNIRHTFSSPPVVLAQCVSVNGSSAVSTRIRNVTTNFFEVRLQEKEGSTDEGNHNYEEAHYILLEQHKNAFIVDNVTDTWKKLPFHLGGAYVASYLFGSVQTMAGPDTCALCQNMVNIGDYNIMLEEETSFDSEIAHPFSERVSILRLFKGLIFYCSGKQMIT